MKYLLGSDIGTSGTKTVLFDEKLNTVASHTVEYPLYQPNPLWAEQEPEDWYNAVVEGIETVLLKSGVSGDDVKGLGLSGQMHGLVLLDSEKNVLRRSIIWCDQRTVKECKKITALVGKERLVEITANPAITAFTASKIMWVKDNEPDIYEKAAHILLPKDYVRFRLTGELATDVSDASGTQLLDVRKRCWSDEILEKLGIDKTLLPKVYESPEITGHITKKVAELTGLSEQTAVVGGAGDQAAAAVGCGIVKEGMVSDTLGSSGVVFAHTDKPLIDKSGRVNTFCHAVPGKWHIMGVTQGAGLSLKWFKENFCAAEMQLAEKENKDVYNIMTEEAMTVPAGSDGLIFLPYLMGERSPILDPDARGALFGLTNAHTRAHIIRSVLEGIMFSQYDCLNVIKELGVTPKEIRMGGGGAKSENWRAMFVDCFDTEIVTLSNTEGGALGVAVLAGVGTGMLKSVESTCEEFIKPKTRILPSGINDYLGSFLSYKEFYSRLKGMKS